MLHTMTAANTPAHNGVAERHLRTIFTLARTMLLHAGLSTSFWEEVVVYANCISNCISTSALEGEGNISPYEVLFRKTPNISQFRVFRCHAQVLIKDTHLTKFQSCTREVIYLGPSQDSTRHRL